MDLTDGFWHINKRDRVRRRRGVAEAVAEGAVAEGAVAEGAAEKARATIWILQI